MAKLTRGKKHVCQSGGLIGRVSKHDRFHIELKYRYQLKEDMKKRSYVCDAFFFIPQHLGVNASSYKVDDLFADSQMYMRLEALPVDLSVLLDDQARANPMRVIERLVHKVAALGTEDASSDSNLASEWCEADTTLLCHEAKLLGATMSEAARNELIILRDDSAGGSAGGSTGGNSSENGEASLDEDEWRQRASLLVQNLSDIIDRFRSLRLALKHPNVDKKVAKTLAVVDEYMSFEIEILFGRLMALSRARDAAYETLWSRISARIIDERQRREHRDANWAEQIQSKKKSVDVEEAWLEFAFFKKVVASCLFLESSESQLSRNISEIVMGLAAALAMTFALAVAVISAYTYPINTMPWLFIAVAGYIFKDRIKEYLRYKGNNIIQPYLADRKSFLSTPLGKKKFAVVTENLSFQKVQQLDLDVQRVRMSSGWMSNILMPGAETVMHFSKKICFRNADVTKIHGQVRNAISIMRIDVRRLLARMDDPYRSVHLVDTDTDNIRKAKIPRIYHVPLIMRYIDIHEGQRTVRYQGLRLILDRRGIRRIEELDSVDRNITRETLVSDDAVDDAIDDVDEDMNIEDSGLRSIDD